MKEETETEPKAENTPTSTHVQLVAAAASPQQPVAPVSSINTDASASPSSSQSKLASKPEGKYYKKKSIHLFKTLC